MDDFLAYTVIGICLGSIFAIAAAGLVLTYTTSGIFNFAHGAVAMFSAVFYWQLHTDWGLPSLVAFALTVFGFAPLLGVFLEVVVMRGLQGTSETTKLVVPIAVLLALNGLATWVWFDDPSQVRRINYFFPQDSVEIFGQPVRYHQLLAIAVAVVLAIVLRLILYRTRLGITMRAVVDDPSLVQLNGGRPDRAALASWAIGAMCAAIAGILIAPQVSLTVLALTLLVVDAYAAAIFGRLRSLPLTFVGAIVLGLAKTYWFWQSRAGGRWPFLQNFGIAVPAVLLFVLLLLLPQDRLRGALVTRTRERFRVPTMRQAVVWGAIFVTGMAMMQALLVDSAVITVSNGIGLALMALSLTLLTGYAGEVNLAVYSFAGIAVIALYQFDVGPTGLATQETMSVAGILLAVAVCAVVGGIVALPALRLRGLYLGLATFAFAVFVQNMVLLQKDTLHFRQFGIEADINLFTNATLTVPRPQWFGIDFLDSNRNYLMLLSIAFALVGIGLIALRRSAYGRMLSAMKDSPAACATLGLNLVRLKLSVFMLSSAIAGLGGVLWTAQQRTVNNTDTFNIFLSLALFMLAVVGGIGYVSGALLAGIFAGVMFVTMDDVFEKLATDYESFEPFFNFLGNFSAFVGAAVAGISLGRNPSGVAQQLMDGYRPLRKAPAAVAVWVAAIVGLWALAWQEIIGNWTFALAVLISGLVVPRVIMMLFPARFAEELGIDRDADPTPLDLVGIERPISLEDVARADEALGISGVMVHEGVATGGS